nr:hypothetical protein [Candidatus Sigynarchaeum springense]MDO8119663.1 hypothetical protein [Candidatus Sigynarchaeota archaeon]
MLVQTIAEQFSFESLLIPYFIILALTIELGLFFIIQKATRKERSPLWILTFSVAMFAFSGVYLTRALTDLVFGSSPDIVESLFQADLVIVSVCAIVIGILMRFFFKDAKMIVQLLPIVVILLGAVTLALVIYSSIVTTILGQVAAALVGVLVIPVAGFPIYILWQLAKRDEIGHKGIFIVIMLGIILNFIGLGFNFQRVQAAVGDAIGAAYPAFKLAVLVGIIAGLSMIAFGFYYIPPVDDFFWINQIVALYVLSKSTRTALFKKIFDQKVVEGFSFGGKQTGGAIPSESAFASGIGGIIEILSETSAADGKKVEFIDQGAVKMLFSYQEDLIFILLAKQASPVLNYKLRSFKDDFLLFFGDMITRFASKPEKFLPAETIAMRIFGIAGEKRR